MADAEIARRARSLLRRAGAGVLSTHSLAMPGYPFGSLAPFVMTHEGRPLFLVSRLAEHTRNLAAEPRACLTVLESGPPHPALARASVLGTVRPLAEAEGTAAAARYLALLPDQRAFLDLGDFSFLRLEPERVRWIGGFGEIRWIERGEWLLATPSWACAERSVAEHMNQDHADALAAICRHRLGATDGAAELVAVDPEGFHVRFGERVGWVAFARACDTAEALRAEMVRLVREARGDAAP
jgi:hypothetical protein